MDASIAIEQPAPHVQADRFSLEANVYGVSYHTNRDYAWNEKNPGLGLTVLYRLGSGFSLIEAVGAYDDSNSRHARYALTGLRYTVGDESRFHASIGFAAGYYRGSGFHGVGCAPEILVGYNRVSLGIVVLPKPDHSAETTSYETNQQTGETTPKVCRYSTSTSAIGAYLNVRIADF